MPAVQIQKFSASDGVATGTAAPLPVAPIVRFALLKVGVTVTVTASEAMVVFLVLL